MDENIRKFQQGSRRDSDKNGCYEGYYGSELTNKVIRNGWLHTGDQVGWMGWILLF
jgi:hypothetical protein